MNKSYFETKIKANKSRDMDTILRKEIPWLLNSSIVSEATTKMLTPHGSQIPELYGFPKQHKPVVLLRPILPMVNLSQHQMAKSLLEMFKPLQPSLKLRLLNNMFKSVKLLDKMDFKHKYLASMYITSLFINIPLEETAIHE